MKDLNHGSETDYSSVRVIQRNLVYIICIPQKYADEVLLMRSEYFGQFGNIKKIVVNRRASTVEATASAYITYSTEAEATTCIEEVDESILDGRVLKCTYGTTKYCTFFLKNITCQNSECMYLHEYKPKEDLIIKGEMYGYKHKLHTFLTKNKHKERIGRRYNTDIFTELFKHKSTKVYKAPDRIIFEPIDFTRELK